ncbi:MAG: 2-oxo acid dehydrogenase subunit E2 [Lewinella sp.]|nr:2-oxo acid dehydrogenase subunit E2 [Lewinella sp.]
MARVELIMPKMGESIMEATILSWVKQVGDTVEEEETVLEIATDKVNSEVPAPVSGKILEILYPEDATVPIGKVIAIIGTESEESEPLPTPSIAEKTPAPVAEPVTLAHKETKTDPRPAPAQPATSTATIISERDTEEGISRIGSDGRFYSPLVRNIAEAENISMAELEQLSGTGQAGRITKKDILKYIENRKTAPVPNGNGKSTPAASPTAPRVRSQSGGEEIVEMDRMRRLIADHMVRSKQTSPHVTSFVEVDVTNIVRWRDKVKAGFQKKYGEKITFTPVFIEAVAKALRDFPMVNVSVEGSSIIVKKDINIGMATALPTGNLIVPVINRADQLNLLGLTKAVNDLAGRARANQLQPDEIQNGTFTLTNVGTFGNVMGTPIINQPQVAIMAVGAIRKKPAVVETEYGDLIAVRHMMFLSMSYDHRVVDGFLGGSFLRRVGDYLEAFDDKQEI